MENYYTLSQLTTLIQEVIDISFEETIRLVAEIDTFTINKSGHVYLELIEKDEYTDNVIAKMRAIIWANNFKLIREYFREITGEDIKEGLKILCTGRVHYHKIYGLSFQIYDIDPKYTLGEWALKKERIIKQLEKENLIYLNKNIEFPPLPQSIAIISSPTAAGLQDFLNHLLNNEYGYKFTYQLFEASMQGNDVEKTVIEALSQIKRQLERFDVAVIIRGGGSRFDLSGFDSYKLAKNIALFPIPVLTGIGHQKDISVADIVAYENLKTPTAVADYLVNRIFNTEQILLTQKEKLEKNIRLFTDNQFNKIDLLKKRLLKITTDILFNATKNINTLREKLHYHNAIFIQQNFELQKKLLLKLKLSTLNIINQQIENLKQHKTRYQIATNNLIRLNNEKLNFLEKKIEILDPKNVLKRGYSITTHNGKIIKELDNIKPQETIETLLYNGKITSKVIEIEKE